MKPPDKRGDHMAVLRVIFVSWTVKVGGHGADGVKAVLLKVRLAHFDS